MIVFGITGWKNSGKTTLVVKLVRTLRERGYTVSTLKHAHHAFDIDREGKDSYLHRSAGACEVMVASGRRWALMHEIGGDELPPMRDLIARMSPVDVLLVEGFKLQDHPKLQVLRPEHNADPLPPEVGNVVAIASDRELDPSDYGCSGPRFDLDRPDEIVDFILGFDAERGA